MWTHCGMPQCSEFKINPFRTKGNHVSPNLREIQAHLVILFGNPLMCMTAQGWHTNSNFKFCGMVFSDAVLSHHYGNLQGANLNSAFFIDTAGLVHVWELTKPWCDIDLRQDINFQNENWRTYNWKWLLQWISILCNLLMNVPWLWMFREGVHLNLNPLHAGSATPWKTLQTCYKYQK